MSPIAMLDLFRAVFAPPRDLILLFAAGWMGLTLAGRRARRWDGDEKALDTLTSAIILAFVVGGRLLFASEHLSAFVQSPLSLISLNTSLFDVWAALACSAIAGAVVIQRKQLSAGHALDLLTPLFAALAIGLSLSHLASGAAFGKEASVPWAIVLWGAARHPTQIYELLAATAALAFIWFGGNGRQPGKVFLLWVALSAASRLFIEGYRGDSTLVFGGLRLAQIIAWLVLAMALGCMEVLPHAVSAGSGSDGSGPATKQGTVPN
jgi:prolipoprotein diacylglyceryltransferase